MKLGQSYSDLTGLFGDTANPTVAAPSYDAAASLGIDTGTSQTDQAVALVSGTTTPDLSIFGLTDPTSQGSFMADLTGSAQNPTVVASGAPVSSGASIFSQLATILGRLTGSGAAQPAAAATPAPSIFSNPLVLGGIALGAYLILK